MLPHNIGGDALSCYRSAPTYRLRNPNLMKKITLIVAAFAALVLVTINTLSAAEQKTIVGVAAGAGQFNTLVAAVKAAGLVETLNGKGPFTVFAPTDEVFAKLPAGTVENLLKPENKEKLVALTYHVLPGELMAADVRTTNAKTVNGKKLAIKVHDGKVTVDGANVVKTDIDASNGVIHVIDAVLIP
jgi:uncharacterized surface protein with fasciclin (FAS1) repeats